MKIGEVLSWIKNRRCMICGERAEEGSVYCKKHKEEAEKKEKEEQTKQKEEIMEKLSDYLWEKGVPEKYVNARIERADLLSPQVRETIRKVMDSNLFFYGCSGSGKTYMAVGVIAEWLRKELLVNGGDVRKVSMRFIVVPDFFVRLKTMEMERMWEEVREVGFKRYLCLDDIGARTMTRVEADMLYEIINNRYNRDDRRMRLIVTSDVSLEEIEEQVHRRLASRLYEMCKVIKFPDKDLRKEARWKRG